MGTKLCAHKIATKLNRVTGPMEASGDCLHKAVETITRIAKYEITSFNKPS